MEEGSKELLYIMEALERGARTVTVTGLEGTSLVYFISLALSQIKRPCIILASEAKDASRIASHLRFFLSETSSDSRAEVQRIGEFSPYDISPLTGLSPALEIITARIESLYRLLSFDDSVVVTSVQGSFLKTLPKSAFLKAMDLIAVGEEVDREALIQEIESLGFHRTSLAEERGDYAVRGGVVDIFPPFYHLPVRLEFWGDQVESIRLFDPATQRSTTSVEELVLLPCSEILTQKEHIERARSMGRLPGSGEDTYLFPGREAWLNHFYPTLSSIFEYLPSDGLLIILDPHRIEDTYQKWAGKFHLQRQQLQEEAREKGRPFPELEGVWLELEQFLSALEDRQQIRFTSLDLQIDQTDKDQIIQVQKSPDLHEDLQLRKQDHTIVSMAPLAQKLKAWTESSGRAVIVTRTEQQAHRVGKILENYQVRPRAVVDRWSRIPKGPGVSICLGRLGKGFRWSELRLWVISEEELFGPKRATPRAVAKDKAKAFKWSSLSSLKPGDLVVHEEHGIGRYQGLVKMDVNGRANDFLLIEYGSNDKLYIPADRINKLQRYVGPDEAHPTLDRLGGRAWKVAKERAKKSIHQIAKQLVELYALRSHRKGFAFSPPDNLFREFEATFEHEETPDQIKALEDVLTDMTSSRPMDRLICGDVGFGKTEVALRAAFKAVCDGKQVAMLVPTTVLAEQHYQTFRKRMSPYRIEVALLSRFKSKKEQSEIIARIRSGLVDVVIGTHRLLQKDIKFHDLGLVIIDEEQRFGVKQKEALKQYRALVDVLALTATPIPRTLQLSLSGVRDLSIIETPPPDRHSIQTYLSHYDEALIVRAIESELDRGGQVFYLHNRVQTIENAAYRLGQLVPHARLAIAHGQMREKELERTMMRFVQKEIDVLVTTTIIESGLDIPSANTIIITDVDRLGLAQIYQLRGRVGRAKERAYAYLILSENGRLSPGAEKRLKALMDFSHLGAGIRLAMHDLEIRGGGNILGFAQSGHVAAVGYELYLKMIEQAVAELKGEQWREELEPEVRMELPAYLPDTYVSDVDLRLNLYKRLSTIKDKTQLKAIKEEIRDRFGPLPREVQNLLELVELKLALKRIGIQKLEIGKEGILLDFSAHCPLDPKHLIKIAQKSPQKIRFLSPTRIKLSPPGGEGSLELYKVSQALESILGFCS